MNRFDVSNGLILEVVLHPLIHVLGMAIPVYGLLLVASFFFAWLTLMVLSTKKCQIQRNDVSLVFLIAMCGGVVGAYSLRPVIRSIYVLLSWAYYAEMSLIELVNFVTGELVFYGGFIGGLIAVVLFCKRYKIKMIPVFDLGAPALAIAHAIGRLGCFFGGCCYGKETHENHPLAIVYPQASLSAPSGVPLLAVPLIEAAFLMCLSVVLSVVYLKSNKIGLAATIYLLAYPIARFILEFFRGDVVRGGYRLLSTSQFISIGVFFFGLALLIYCQSTGKFSLENTLPPISECSDGSIE